MGATGTLRVQARRALSSEIAQHPELEPVPHVLISIADTGHGIPAELVSRVFEPSFTTKGAGKGTGLGLATVQRVAKEHGGGVYLTSEHGVGTTVRILLPASARRPNAATRQGVGDRPKTGPVAPSHTRDASLT
jgi:signal transduction histidine kinase